MNGVELIAQERERQITEEGFTAAHDDEHNNFSLASAAACYASPDLIFVEKRFDGEVHFVDPWPWGAKRDKRRINGALHGNTPFARSHDERVRQLTIAGALIAAEIDRLIRRKGSGANLLES